MKNTKKVSVIIPAYNSGKYIKNVLDSVLNQSYRNYELIIIEDGSTDNTREIITQCAMRNAQYVKYICQKNRGPASARNRGIKEAKGEYIAFLDSDDISLPDRIKLQVNCLDKNPDVGVVDGWWGFINEKGDPLNIPIRCPSKNGYLLKEYLSGELDFAFSSIMIRRSWLDRVGLFDEELAAAEDLDLILRLTLHGAKIFHIPSEIIKYRINDGISSDPDKVFNNMAIVLDKFYSNKNLPEDIRKLRHISYCNHIYYECCWHYYYKDDIRWKKYLKETIRQNPEILLKPGIFDEWLFKLAPLSKRENKIIYENMDLFVNDLDEFLLEFFSDVDIVPEIINSKKNIYSAFHRSVGIRYYLARNMRSCRNSIRKAISINPLLICDLQVIRTYFKSFMPLALLARRVELGTV